MGRFHVGLRCGWVVLRTSIDTPYTSPSHSLTSTPLGESIDLGDRCTYVCVCGVVWCVCVCGVVCVRVWCVGVWVWVGGCVFVLYMRVCCSFAFRADKLYMKCVPACMIMHMIVHHLVLSDLWPSKRIKEAPYYIIISVLYTVYYVWFLRHAIM